MSDQLINIGTINDRLGGGIKLTGLFVVESLRITPAQTDKRAQLFTEEQFKEICEKLAKFVLLQSKREFDAPAPKKTTPKKAAPAAKSPDEDDEEF